MKETSINKRSNQVTHLPLFDDPSTKKQSELTRTRFSLDEETTKKLEWLTERDGQKNKKYTKRWYPKDTIKLLIDNAYQIRKIMEGEK